MHACICKQQPLAYAVAKRATFCVSSSVAVAYTYYLHTIYTAYIRTTVIQRQNETNTQNHRTLHTLSLKHTHIARKQDIKVK